MPSGPSTRPEPGWMGESYWSPRDACQQCGRHHVSVGPLAMPQGVAAEGRLRHRGGGCLPAGHTTGEWQGWDLDPGLSDILDCARAQRQGKSGSQEHSPLSKALQASHRLPPPLRCLLPSLPAHAQPPTHTAAQPSPRVPATALALYQRPGHWGLADPAGTTPPRAAGS